MQEIVINVNENNDKIIALVENGKLIEKQTRTYDLYNYGFMEVGCV